MGGPGVKVLRSLGVEPEGVPSPFPRYRLLKDGVAHLMPSGPGSLLRTRVIGSAGKAQFARLLGLLPLLKTNQYAGISVRDWLVTRVCAPMSRPWPELWCA